VLGRRAEKKMSGSEERGLHNRKENLLEQWGRNPKPSLGGKEGVGR